MTTTVATGNMSGNQKRAVQRAVNQILTPELAKLGAEEGERLFGDLSGLQSDIAPFLIAAVRRRSAVAWDPSLVAFERNQHGHIEFDIIGLDLSGAEEVDRLIESGYRVGDYARSCFTSAKNDGYDKNHRLAAGERQRIVLMPGTVIARDRDRTTANLQRFAAEQFGYEKPKGGIIPRTREAVSDKQMEEWGTWYIAALHDPMSDSGGRPLVLSAHRYDGGRWVGACWGYPGYQWDAGDLFAFVVPAK